VYRTVAGKYGKYSGRIHLCAALAGEGFDLMGADVGGFFDADLAAAAGALELVACLGRLG
jgi:hypothetical protein